MTLAPTPALNALPGRVSSDVTDRELLTVRALDLCRVCERVLEGGGGGGS